MDADTARAYVTADVTTRDPATGEQTLDSREAQLSLVKRDGAWVVSEAELRDHAKAEEPAPPPSRP